MKTRTFTSIAVMTALGVFLPMSSSYAFGLGKIELSSALNQPFRAQIPVTTLREEEKGNLQVQLASGDEFERAGLERSYYLTQFEFTIVENNGQTAIDIRSKKPVKEPFIDLLLTATAGQGRLIREYIVLLDPPKDIFVKPEVKPTVVTTKTKQASSPKTSHTAPVTTTNYSSASSYGPTDRNDTLWGIAVKTKQADTSINQMMMALLNENPKAFSNNNINGLKAGYTLDIPSATAIKKLSKSQATAAVSEQNTLWKNRNVKAAPAKVETVVTETAAEDSADQQPSAMTTAKENDQAMAEQEDSARLKLVAPSDDTASDDAEMSPMGDAKLSELSEQLTLAQETIETQRQENIDISARMAAMEEQIETLRRLLSLKDPDLAVLQSTLEQQQVAGTAASEVAAQTELVEAENTEALATEASDNAAMLESEALAEQTPAETEQQMMAAEDTVGTAMNDDNDSTQTAMSSPESESTAVEKALDSVGGAVDYVSDLAGLDNEQVKSKYDQAKTYINEHKKESTLGGLLLLLVLWLIISFRKRRYVAWDEAVNKKSDKEETQVSHPQIVDNNDVVDTEVPAEAEQEPEKTIEQLVNDADVYVSYGDFSKANQTLQMAHDAEPNNEEIIHKLLFVLFKQAQVSDFVALAQYYQNETTAPEWDEVVSWGQELAPHEELFQPVITNVVESVPELDANAGDEDLSLDIQGVDTSPTDSVDDVLKSFDATQQQAGDDEFTVDINTDSSEVADSDERLSLPEVEPLDLETESSEQEASSDVETSTMEFDLDISDDDAAALDIDDIEAITDDDLSEANAALADSELEFDLGDFDQVDESETKLDLAAAYIDMGDPDGAKNILQEVLTEGNDDQKARAETMLSDLN